MKSRTLLHLSDIHFKYRTSNTNYDLDDVIRHELERDATTKSAELGGTDAVIVCGDVAFGAVEQEYDIAYEWLQKLGDKVKSPDRPIQIWTVPGNHDIDWKKIEGNRNAERLRSQLRDSDVKDFNRELRKTLDDLNDRQTLLDPLEQYNIFANKLGCASGADPLYWEQPLLLNDGSTLRVRGLNSTIISARADDDQQEKTKLVLSSYQTKFFREDDIVFMTVCHHPLDWLKDRNDVDDWLNQHARIQLFGHRHIQRVTPIHDNLRIASGAVHPVREEPGWEPRYNFISIDVRFEQNRRWLHVEVHPRIWNDTSKQFVADNLGVQSRDLPLPARQPSSTAGRSGSELTNTETVASVLSAIEPDLLDVQYVQSGAEVRILNAGERLTSRYLSLPHNLQMEIAKKLGLQEEEEDKDLADTELYRRYFKRAKDKRLLEQFWSEVEIQYAQRGEEHFEENPFVGR